MNAEPGLMAGRPDLGGRVSWDGTTANLTGARCTRCGNHAFPFQESCPSCTGGAMEAVALPRTGVVWTWTVQRIPPKPPFLAPDPFEPFAVAYVDLGGVVRVETRLAGRDPGDWSIGDRVVLHVDVLPGQDPADDRSWTHCFVPDENGG